MNMRARKIIITGIVTLIFGSLLALPALAHEDYIKIKPRCIPTGNVYKVCDLVSNKIPLQFSRVVGVVNKDYYVTTLHHYIIEKQRQHFVLLEMKKQGNITGQQFGKLNSELNKDVEFNLLMLNENLKRGTEIGGETRIGNATVVEMFDAQEELREKMRNLRER